MPLPPTICSWLKVKIFLRIITQQTIRRDTCSDVTELQAAIRTYRQLQQARYAVLLDRDRRRSTR